MTVFAFSLVTYFIVTGGVIYDVINEPPSVGQFQFFNHSNNLNSKFVGDFRSLISVTYHCSPVQWYTLNPGVIV